MIKDKECIKCKRFWNCNGKPKKEPCLHFVERKKKDDLEQQVQEQKSSN